MKKSLLLSSVVGLFLGFAACDSSDGGSDGTDASASGGTSGGAGVNGGAGTGAGGTAGSGTGGSGTGGSGTAGSGTGGSSNTGGAKTGGTGGASSTAGNCILPTVVGSCVVPVAGNPVGICQEYYNATIYTAATIKQICDAVKGVASTGACPKASQVGFCDVAPGGMRLFNQYYYGAVVDSYKQGCMAGGGMWCTP